MALFLDTFVNKLDRKGRVSVPAAYRQQLASQPFQGIIALPSFKHPAIHCGDLTWLAEVSRDLEKAVRAGGLSGAIYTQTTDVENEVNGYLSYDRRLIKMALPTVAERNRAVIAAGTDPSDRR